MEKNVCNGALDNVFFHTRKKKAQLLLLELNLDSRNTCLGRASRLLCSVCVVFVWSVCVLAVGCVCMECVCCGISGVCVWRSICVVYVVFVCV